RFSMRARYLMNAYQQGLNGRRTAWVAREFHGHGIIPAAMLQQFDHELEKLG
ncbi:hypothetical protein P691DRAFT_676779, partial [Macrolepiota fuliginosa MF-IS2]